MRTKIKIDFRGLYGQHAGWAHSVLFSADLRQFRDTAAVDTKKKVKKVKG